MKLCLQTTIFLLISILGITLNIYFVGMSTIEFIQNIIFTLVIAFVTNWSCSKNGYKWIAWLIVIISLIALSGFMFLKPKSKNKKEQN
jgi:hypothetical protein